MPSSLLSPLFTWFYILCVMIMMKTQLLNAAQYDGTRDLWPDCHDYKSSCGVKPNLSIFCPKTCNVKSPYPTDPKVWRKPINPYDLPPIKNPKKFVTNQWDTCNVYKRYCKKQANIRRFCPETCRSSTAGPGIIVAKRPKPDARSRPVATRRPTPDNSAPTQSNCKDVWTSCKGFTILCKNKDKKNDIVRERCKKTCGLCEGGSIEANSGMGDERSKTVSANSQTPDNSAPTQDNCKDVWTSCKRFTILCKNKDKKNDIVRKRCKKTCQLCEGSGSMSQGRLGTLPQNNAPKNSASPNKAQLHTAKSTCKDSYRDNHCYKLYRDDCKNYERTALHVACPETCGLCKAPTAQGCEDKWPMCHSYILHCDHDIVKNSCRITCKSKLCTQAQLQKAETALLRQGPCKDKWDSCRFHKTICCSALKENCKKTCELCEGPRKSCENPHYVVPTSANIAAVRAGTYRPKKSASPNKAQSQTSRGKCVELQPNCHQYIAHCRKNAIRKLCPITCGVCTPPKCKDEWSRCKTYRSTCELTATRNMCKKTCGLC